MKPEKKMTEPTHTGKRGEHPVAAAMGATLGAVTGAAVVGATQGGIAGTAAGLPGMAAGVATGAVVGALAGKGLAQEINPTTEDAFWSNNYRTRSYVSPDEDYDTYGPAYRYGIKCFTKYEGRNFDEIEPMLSREWEEEPNATLPWQRARPAVQDAYERLCRSKA
jgi:hypothetical protein